jgi:hypothetical protein
VPDETRDVQGGVGGEELQRLAHEREAHGARREPAVAARVPPPVHRAQQQHKQRKRERGTGEPHLDAHLRNPVRGELLRQTESVLPERRVGMM